MNINIIVGNPNTRKSSTIRSLSGIRDASIYDIEHTNEQKLPTLVIPSALQELYQVGPQDFINYVDNQEDLEKDTPLKRKIASRRFNDILICLHEKTKNGLPDADDYIEAFKDAGWIITNPIVSFNSSYRLPEDYINTLLPMPANAIANNIRNRWGWL